MNTCQRFIILLVFTTVLSTPMFADTFYWIGGTGDWDDGTHWAIESGGSAVNVVPGQNDDAIFDKNSFMAAGQIVTIPIGQWGIDDFIVMQDVQFSFELHMDGTSTMNDAEMYIHDDLVLSNLVTLTYDTSAFGFKYGEWHFTGVTTHSIFASGHDLVKVYFETENAVYSLQESLTASSLIRLSGGECRTNGHTVTTELMSVSSGCSSLDCATKSFVFGGSEIHCNKFLALFNYGSFSMSGNAQIYVSEVECSSIDFDEVYLQDYEPTTTISTNNLRCDECSFNKLVVQDVGLTRIAGDIEVINEFIVENQNSIIEFSNLSNQGNSFTCNGTISTPTPGTCTEFTRFRPKIASTSDWIRSSGTLNVDYAIFEGIVAQGGASFNASNSIIDAASTGWNLLSAPPSKTFVWEDMQNGNNLWSDPINWKVNGMATTCLPSPADRVIFNNGSFQANANPAVKISANFHATCSDFLFENSLNDRHFIIEGSIPGIAGSLTVFNDFGVETNKLQFDAGTGELNIQAMDQSYLVLEGSYLSELNLIGGGTVNVGSDLNIGRLFIDAGTFNTNNLDITVDNFFVSSNENIDIDFGSSFVDVAVKFSTGPTVNETPTIHPGTSYISCQEFTGFQDSFHIVQLNNPALVTLKPINYHFHKLILNGSGKVSSNGSVLGPPISIDSLIFVPDDAELSLDVNHVLQINEGIRSEASVINPAKLNAKSVGSHLSVDVVPHNLCVEGNIAFKDLDVEIPGVFNAPDGIDEGNNLNINFADGSTSDVLYWVGGKGNWNDQSNWSGLSGGCPATTDPSSADEIIIDNNSFQAGEDTIFINTTESCHILTIANSAVPGHISLGKLFPDEVNVDSGKISISGFSLDIIRHLELKNNGQFTFTNMNLFVASIPDSLTQSPLMINSGHFSGPGSNLFFSALPGANAVADIFIAPGAITNLGTTNFYPVRNGISENIEMDLNGKSIQNLEVPLNFFNTIKITSDMTAGEIDLNSGALEIAPGVNVFVQ